MQSLPKRKWRSSVLAVSGSRVRPRLLPFTPQDFTQVTTWVRITVIKERGCSEAHYCVVKVAKLPSLSSPLAIRREHINTNAAQLESRYIMAQQRDETIDRIRVYAKDACELHDGLMELDASNTEARLAQTVRELQACVEKQQAALERVKECS